MDVKLIAARSLTDPSRSRFESIDFYLDLNGLEHYLVLDDNAEAFPEGWKHLVQCDPLRGISALPAQERIRRFLEEPKT